MADWGAIFDMDGVVVDTVGMHFRAWARVFAEHGRPITMEDFKAKVDGIPRRDGARAILPDLSEAELDRACEVKQGYFLEALEREPVPAYPGTVALVKAIRASDRKTALIASGQDPTRIVAAAGVADLWDAIVSGAEVARGKPDPQVFLMAAERIAMPTSRCVVVEDAMLGVEAAVRAGMRCIGIDRHGDPGRLAKADRIVTDLSELTLADVEALFRHV